MFGKKKDMSPVEQKAKLAALRGTNKEVTDMMKKDLAGVKKVSVMAPSKEGLKKGLDMAEKIVGEQEDEDSELGEKMEDAQEGYEDQCLMELKAKLSQE